MYQQINLFSSDEPDDNYDQYGLAIIFYTFSDDEFVHEDDNQTPEDENHSHEDEKYEVYNVIEATRKMESDLQEMLNSASKQQKSTPVKSKEYLS